MNTGALPLLPNEESSVSYTKIGGLLDSTCFQNGIYKHSEEYGTGVPILRIGDFDNQGRLTTTSFSRVALSPRERDQYAIRANDIIINRVNSLSHIGKSVLIPPMQEYPVFESNMMRLRIREESPLAPEYVAVVLQAEAARKHFRKVAKPAVAQASINQDDVRAVVIALYPKFEQKIIADAILTWMFALEMTEQLITSKRRRLAEFRKNLFDRRSRQGFVRIRLESVLKGVRELSDGNLPVYSVSVHKGLVNQIEHLGRSFSAATTAHYNLVRPGDIVYTKSPTGDFPYGIVKQSLANESAAVSPLYGVYRPSTTDVGTLIDFFFESPVNARNYLHPLVQKGAKNTIGISNDEFLKGQFTLPEKADNVAQLASFVREAHKEIALLQESVAALAKQKRGLMRKLLTGQWRLGLPKEVPA